jgi:hypothetical protein
MPPFFNYSYTRFDYNSSLSGIKILVVLEILYKRCWLKIKKTSIIVEISNTHEGSLGFAKQFIKAAAECGVDAVKIQTHIFDTESLLSAPNPP